MAKRNELFTKKVADLRESIKRDQERAALYIKLSSVFSGLDLFDVQSTYAFVSYSGKINVSFVLKEDRRDSKLAHKLAQRFGCDFKKEKSWDNQTLVYRAETADFYLEVSGAVPATCKVVEKEVALSEEEIAAAVANIKRTKIVREINCMADAVAEMEPMPMEPSE